MADQNAGTGPIVVGVDGSDSSKRALRWAVHQAELTHSAVLAVTAWDLPATQGGAIVGLMPPVSDATAQESETHKQLREVVADTVGAHPPVEVRTEVRYGSAAEVLIDAADDASLLVVGSRGLGAFSRLLLGSVAQHCVQNAACPVLVVREGHDENQ
jgi:nucleotide-binding universal stress UspA family protein